MDNHLQHALFEEFVRETNLVPEEDLIFATQKSHTDNLPLQNTLIELGLLSPEEVTRALAHVHGISFVDLVDQHIDHEVLQHIPEPISRTHNIVCFNTNYDALHIACIDLEATKIAQELHPEKTITPFFTNKQSLKYALKKYQKNLFETFGSQLSVALGNMRNPELFKGLEEWLPTRYHTEIAEDVSSDKVLRNILKQAYTAGASHVYLSPTEDNTVVSYRINRRLVESMRIGKDAHSPLVIKLRHMIDQSIVGTEIKSGYAVFEHGDHKFPIQVLFFKTPHGIKSVIRLLKERALFDPIEYLFASSLQQEFMYSQLDNSAITLVAGKPKSGVTRAYYGILEHLIDHKQEIISIEDPLEVALPTISQVSVRTKKDHKQVLQQVIEARPDVIGFSPFRFESYTRAFATVPSGIKLVSEIPSTEDYFETLFKNKLLTKELLAQSGLVVTNAVFTEVPEELTQTTNLTKEQQTRLERFMSETEILDFLKTELAIDESITSLRKVDFTTKAKKKLFAKTKSEKKQVYVRGGFSPREIGSTFGDQDISMPTFKKRLRMAEKKAVLQNALLLSLQGKIDIKDIVSYING